MEDRQSRYVVVGVTPKQPPVVLPQAARFARHFEAMLVCANVDPGRYVVAEHPDGSVTSRPIDPDQADWDTGVFDPGLADRIQTLAQDDQVQVTFRALAGDIGHALGRLAELLQAEMIIVGSRRGGLKTGMHDLFGGSIAVHLIHRQPRPVVVIPLTPSPAGERAPGEKPHR